MGYTHGRRWSNSLIKKEILKCMDSLELPRMPTFKEMQSYTGDRALTNAISKRGGCRKFAKELGVELKNSQTKKGWDGEVEGKRLLEERGYKVECMTSGENFDLLVNDLVKVDVKSGKQYLLDKYKMTTFGINNKHPHCDIYMLLDYHDQDIGRVLIVPAVLLSFSTTMSIGESSKYDKWIDKYEVINEYISFYNKISNTRSS